MLFEITRTSMWNNEKPCEEAKKITLVRVDTRTCSSPEQFDSFKIEKKPWLSEGTNHRIVNGHIQRDVGFEETWGIEINTLEDILSLYKKYGKLVIRMSYIDEETPSIEIYDTYRE